MTQAPSAGIGGEFDLVPADVARTSSSLPTLGAAHELWVDVGRSALALAARAHLAAGRSPRVWMPAYGCHSMVVPFEAQGFNVDYFRVGAHLDAVDCEPAPGDALLFVHYFGKRNQAALQAVDHWRANEVTVIEDCVHAAFDDSVGRHGDHAITSLRKLLPVVDGAMLASRRPIAATLSPADETFVSARAAGRLLRTADVADADYMALFHASEDRIAPATPREMSWLSRRLLASVDLVDAAARRRANLAYLERKLRGSAQLSGVLPLVSDWLTGETPLGLIVRVPRGERDRLRAHLAAQRIYCPVHWPLPHVPEDAFPEEHALSRSLLTLPIDQRHDTAQLERLIIALQHFPGDLR